VSAVLDQLREILPDHIEITDHNGILMATENGYGLGVVCLEPLCFETELSVYLPDRLGDVEAAEEADEMLRDLFVDDFQAFGIAFDDWGQLGEARQRSDPSVVTRLYNLPGSMDVSSVHELAAVMELSADLPRVFELS